ncbi:hypothetical protein ACFQZU_05650, partial [Streptomonospora algeriensis]
MSLLLMVLALLGALAVLGLGAWVAAQLGRGDRDVEPGEAASAVAAPSDPPAGGYTLLEGGREQPAPVLPGDTVTRVRGLLAEG